MVGVSLFKSMMGGFVERVNFSAFKKVYIYIYFFL